ncbi:hypothetical protein AIT66_24405 (plasmid) [Salmonella enterica subsp. salamae]|uniref:Type 1 fimbrial protein n=1 Tax=Salmonella enterica subsp. salamae TaxID=59202 RepID=A0A8E6IN57_SALER|nr:hypothetical protein [Salmonella enterica]QVP52792.1 hypothetical protein AIT66_24405 [Salmonella enterica subsp. salamae]
MKNHYKVIAIAALMFSSSAAIGASSGTINFTGEVKPTTCDVLINGVASPVTINLPAVDQH